MPTTKTTTKTAEKTSTKKTTSKTTNKTKVIKVSDDAIKFKEIVVNKKPFNLDFKKFVYFIFMIIRYFEYEMKSWIKSVLIGSNRWPNTESYWDAIINVISCFDRTDALIKEYPDNFEYEKNRVDYKTESMIEYMRETGEDVDESVRKTYLTAFEFIEDLFPDVYKQHESMIKKYRDGVVTKEMLDIIEYVYRCDYIIMLVYINMTVKCFDNPFGPTNQKLLDLLVKEYLVNEKVQDILVRVLLSGQSRPGYECKPYKEYRRNLSSRLGKIKEDEYYRARDILEQIEPNHYVCYTSMLNLINEVPQYKDIEFTFTDLERIKTLN